MTLDLHSRQRHIFDPANIQARITIVGAGSIGSNLALLLSRLGITDITVYDDDKVEAHNLGHQAYRLFDIDTPKVAALKDIIKDATGTLITAIEEKTDGKNIDTDILILAVDSMEARENIVANAKYSFLVDGRMGGETFNIFACDSMDDKYAKTIFPDSEAVDLPCGGKSIGYISYLIAGLMENAIKKFLVGDRVPFEQSFCAINNIYITSKE